MSYTELPHIFRGILLVFTTLVLIMYIYVIVRMTGQRRKKRERIVPGLLLTVVFVLFQIMCMIQEGDFVPKGSVPLEMIIPTLLILLTVGIFLIYAVEEWPKEHISPMSVKEAFDKLPAGLVYYTGSGLPIMVNETMQGLSMELLGKPVSDAVVFWDTLKNRLSEDVQDENLAIVRCSRGSIYSIKRNFHMINNTEVTELIALDISREYELTNELEQRRAQTKRLNTRLKALIGTIEYVTMNREQLQLKRALHDNIGQSMLIAKRYLYAPDSVDKKHMLDLWRGNIAHLINDEPEEWELPYYVITREADKLGIRLNVTGELPTENELIPIVDAAISTQLGNTLKHADGDEIFISVTEQKKLYVISFTNNGRQPVERIEEKGGLLNLRRDVERIGGTMRILTRPRFELLIILPREV